VSALTVVADRASVTKVLSAMVGLGLIRSITTQYQWKYIKNYWSDYLGVVTSLSSP